MRPPNVNVTPHSEAPMQARLIDWSLRGIVVVNAALLALLFVPAFSGVGAAPGMADRLWGDVRLGGWRADVVWVAASSVFVAIAAFTLPDTDAISRTTRRFCRAWLVGVLVYLGYAVVHMFG